MTVNLEFVYIFKKSKVVFQLKEISLFGNNFKSYKNKDYSDLWKRKGCKNKSYSLRNRLSKVNDSKIGGQGIRNENSLK